MAGAPDAAGSGASKSGVAVNNFQLLPTEVVTCFSRATNSSHPNTGVEIPVPGRGLLFGAEFRFLEAPISLSVRRAFFGRKPGFAPGPPRPDCGRQWPASQKNIPGAAIR